MAMRRTATVSIAGAVQAPETSEAAAPGPAVAERELASPLDTATPDASEATWRAAFEAAREEIRRAEDRIVLGEQELTELNNQLLTRSDIYNREYQLAPMIAAKQQEIAQARDRLVEASQAIEQLQSNLRRAGLPAGWAR
jgi:predicted RNase H-like nuclease (RuvC/YqgF family)